MFTPSSAQFEPAATIALAMEGLNFLPDFGGEGLLAGNLVETSDGWCPVERLRRGTRIATYDGGFAQVMRVERRHIWPAARAGLVHIPGGALDNCSDVEVLPGQQVLIVEPLIEDMFDCAGALVPASALIGFRGISRRPLTRPVEVLSLRFTDSELVFVNSGTLVHCAADGPASGQEAFFATLNESQVRDMLSALWQMPALPDQQVAA